MSTELDEAVRCVAFSDAKTAYRSFVCDQTCNSPSDVCLHGFAWPCPSCGNTVKARGEDMLGYDETNGECLRCYIG